MDINRCRNIRISLEVWKLRSLREKKSPATQRGGAWCLWYYLSMKISQKGFVPIIIAIVAIIVLGGGYFGYKYFFTPQPTCWPYCPNMTDQGRAGIKKSALEAETANWQTYKNEKYGFEFKSPARRVEILSTNSNNDYLGGTREFYGLYGESSQDFSARVDIYTNVSLNTVIKDNWFINTKKVSGKIVINSITWTTVGTEEYLVEHNGSTYEISGRSDIVKPVLETFKFTSPATTATNEQKVAATAKEVLGALAARDYQKLGGLVSEDGLSMDLYPRFSPVKNVIAKDDVSKIPAAAKTYLWGYTDGKGDAINLTAAEFINKYIYTHDYLKAPNVAVKKMLGSGNSLNTIDGDVAGRTYAAFNFSGFDPKYAGMDWTTIYLIFDSVNGEYKLRGIAKDNWTI